MAHEPKNTPIQNVYAQRLAEDLAANRKEQEDITAQLAHVTGLQERLEQLQTEEAWLTGSVQGALPTADSPAEAAIEPAAGAAEAPQATGDEQPELGGAPAETGAEVPAVPNPRKDVTAKAAKTSPPAKKAAAVKAKAPAKKTVAKKTTTAKKEPSVENEAAKKPDEPPLHQLILALLLKTPGEPRLVREVLNELNEAHPERATSIQVVRNNLEALVKKKTIEKSHQQNSAMYIAHAADTAGAEADQSAETADEQVPANA